MKQDGKQTDDAIAAAKETLSQERVNVLIAGNTGAGKTTLVKAIFPDAEVVIGEGAPQTKELEKHPIPGTLLTLWDTRGLEAGSTEALLELENAIDKARKSENIHDQVHVAWLCIASPSRRIEPVHEDFLRRMEKMQIPTIVVFTQSYLSMSLEARGRAQPCNFQVEVLALKETSIDREPFGLDVLVEKTDAILPDGVKAAFAAAQGASWVVKKSAARTAVNLAVAAASGTALLPAHTVSLLAIQAGMFVRIDHIYGLDKADPARAMIKSAATGGARQIGTFIFKSLISDALQATGVGYFAGAAAGAAVGGTITGAVGHAYVEGISRYVESGQNGNLDNIVNVVAAAFRAAQAGGARGSTP